MLLLQYARALLIFSDAYKAIHVVYRYFISFIFASRAIISLPPPVTMSACHAASNAILLIRRAVTCRRCRRRHLLLR